MQKNNDLPLNWPFCSYDGSKLGLEDIKQSLGKTYIMPTDRRDCCQIASWAVQLDYNDDKSEIALLCTTHFTTLPQKPDGSFYRIFRLTIRNYQNFLRREEHK